MQESLLFIIPGRAGICGRSAIPRLSHTASAPYLMQWALWQGTMVSVRHGHGQHPVPIPQTVASPGS